MSSKNLLITIALNQFLILRDFGQECTPENVGDFVRTEAQKYNQIAHKVIFSATLQDEIAAHVWQLLNPEAADVKKYARVCSVTGEGMNEGWLWEGEDVYIKYITDHHAKLESMRLEIIHEAKAQADDSEHLEEMAAILDQPEPCSVEDLGTLAHLTGFCYWTDWHDEEPEEEQAVSDEPRDLFEFPDELPLEVLAFITQFEDAPNDYKFIKQVEKQLNALGYGFEYGLDSQPYNLHKLKPLSIIFVSASEILCSFNGQSFEIVYQLASLSFTIKLSDGEKSSYLGGDFESQRAALEFLAGELGASIKHLIFNKGDELEI